MNKEVTNVSKFEFISELPKDAYGIDSTEKYFSGDLDREQFRNEVITFLALNKKREATELLTRKFLELEEVHTLRNDVGIEMWIYRNGIYIPQAKSYIKEYLRTVLGNTYTTNLLNDVLIKLEADTFIDAEEFFEEPDPWLLPVKNGILNVKTLELADFDPHKISGKFFFNKIPVNYRLQADCANIKTFFLQVLPSQDDVDVLQEVFGSLLYREYLIEKAVMFTGRGRNGKGKTIELMKCLLGVENCTNLSLTRIEKDNFCLGELHKKLANLGADLSATGLKETGTFKMLTGRDRINAARKFLVDVCFTNYAKMIFSANELPKTADDSDAFWNRWVLLEFPYQFLSEKEYEAAKDKTKTRIADPTVIDKIATAQELSGLLNWALHGLARLQKKGDYSTSTTSEQLRLTWIRKSDSLMAFIMDTVEESEDGRIPKSSFRQQYTNYCKKHKIKPQGDQAIRRTLTTNLGCWDERPTTEGEKGSTFWCGIKLKTPQPDTSPEPPEDKITE
jgi:putative DNA primase/helicase